MASIHLDEYLEHTERAMVKILHYLKNHALIYLFVRTFSPTIFVSGSNRFCDKMMVKTACERLLVSFMLVAATVLQQQQSILFIILQNKTHT
jgi:hypothetical protein